MAYGTPTDPVAGTAITVAYAVANILDPIRWLRQMTGNADPPGSNYVVVSSSTTGTAWSRIPTDALADLAVSTNKIAAATVTQAKIANDAVGTAQLVDANVTTAKLADANVTTAKIADSNITTAKIADTNVTAAKLASGAAASNIGTAGVTASMLASGAALSNLGFTPSRIVSGTYSGTGATSARWITTGFAVKFVIIHQPSADVMYVAINTTSSLRLGPSPTFVQGSASVHTHASDGFVVSDGSVQGNVAGSDNYSYTAFG